MFISDVTCRFEQLALGYDEDDIGSLADDDPDIAGDTGLDEVSDALVILRSQAEIVLSNSQHRPLSGVCD